MQKIIPQALATADFSVTGFTVRADNWLSPMFHDYRQNGRLQNLLHIITEGERRYTFDGEEFTVGVGCLIFIPAGTKYFTECIGRCSGIGVCFSFTDDIAVEQGVYRDITDSSGRFLRLFERLVESDVTSPGGILAKKTLVMRILDAMTAEYRAESDRARLIAPGVRFIREHYCEKLAVARYAEAANLSENYFRRLFVRVMGMSPVEYRDALRLEAVERLRSRHIPMNEIAETVGFCDAAYLRKLMKKRRVKSSADIETV